VIPGDNGVFIALDENGTPLGEWHWDEELSEWIFDAYPPLTDLPQTGVTGIRINLWLFIGFLVAGIAAVLKSGSRRAKKAQQ